MRLFLALIAVAYAAAISPVATADDAPRPNILFILVDDLGWGDLGLYHQNHSTHVRRHRTPNLDEFGRQGLQMRRHYCPAPVCAPSRASLLSGRHQGHCEIRDNQFDKALPDNHNVATVLRSTGYATAMIGKYGLQGDGDGPATWDAYPTRRGFDFYFGIVPHRGGHQHYPGDRWPAGDGPSHRAKKRVFENDVEVTGLTGCYTADLYTARCKRWLVEHRASNPDQPFLLFLTYDTPHAALQLPTTAYPGGGGVDGGVRWIGEPGRMINTARQPIDSYRHPEYVGRGWSDAEERFATSIRRLDDAVGDLIRTLDDLGIAEKTLVVFTSDNGPHEESYLDGEGWDAERFQSYGPLEGIKRDVLDGGLRVPTLARWPGTIPSGATDGNPSQFHDWAATFAALAGVPSPAVFDGTSMVPTLTGDGPPPRHSVYTEYNVGSRTPAYDDIAPHRRGVRRGQSQALFVGRYKALRMGIDAAGEAWQLFDITRDPAERHDIADRDDETRTVVARVQRTVRRMRVPEPSASRPYDDDAVPALMADETFDPRGAVAVGTHDRVIRIDGDRRPLDELDLEPGQGRAVVVERCIEVKDDGRYRIAVEDPRKVVVRLHAATVLDTDRGETAERTVTLEAGNHPLTIHYLGGGDPPAIRMESVER